MILGLLVIWAILGAIVGAIAQGRGRPFWGWFFYGFFLFPIALIHVLAAGDSRDYDRHLAAAVHAATRRKCPFCAESIKAEAIVCRYCGRDLPSESDGGTAPPVTFVPDGV